MKNPTSILMQLALALADILPDAFSQAKNPKIRRYDCVVGLLGEPIWLWYGYKTEQWAFTFLGFVFLIICGYAFYHKWILGDLTYGEEKEEPILTEQKDTK